MSVATGTILGRDAELRRIEAFLDGGGGVLLLEGEAGIGKTTVWREALDAAARRSIRVLRAQPAESERALSHAGLTDLLAESWDELRDDLPAPQRYAVDVTLLRVDADVRPDPRSIATAFASTLRALARSGHVLVAVDDVQWLDPDSARVLEFAARRLPVGVGLLLAQRRAADSDVAPPLGLARAPDGVAVERLHVGPLSLAALHHALKAKLGIVLPRPLLAQIASASGGNPFYAFELARASAEAGSLTVPGTLHELVDSRLASLAVPARSALLLAAALSRPTLDLVEAAEGAGARAALADAADAGIVQLEAEGRIRFSHPLLATAVYDAADPGVRRSVHRGLADVVEAIEERGRHLALSTTGPNEQLAAEIERGADAAERRGAPAAAAELYSAAHRLTPAGGDADARIRRLLGFARALHSGGEPGRARAAREEAVEAAPPGRVRALALLHLSWSAWFDSTPQDAAALLERALADLSDEDAELARELRARLARWANANPAQALHHAEAILPELDEAREPAAVARALIGLFLARVLLGEGADDAVLERALALEEAAGDPFDGVVLPWFIWMDDVERASSRWGVQDALAAARGDEDDRAERQAAYAQLLIHSGDWDTAARLLDEACQILAETGATGPNASGFAHRAYLDAQRGSATRAREALDALLEGTDVSWWNLIHVACLADIEFADGDAAAAEEQWRRLEAGLAEIGIREAPFARADADRIEALVSLGELDRAREVLAHLEWRGQTLPRLWIDATLPRARALVLTAEGDVAGAAALLEAAPEVAGLPFELARTLLVRGTLQRRLKQKRAAADTLTQALEIFERLGSPPWIERTREELARVGLRRAAGDELTETERRIAELAASGLTNREVAEAAFVSPKTVEANLARVYRKLGIRSRAELGARMVGLG